MLGHVLYECDSVLVSLEEPVVVGLISHCGLWGLLLAFTRVNFTVELHGALLDLTPNRRDVIIGYESVIFCLLDHPLRVFEELFLLKGLRLGFLGFF